MIFRSLIVFLGVCLPLAAGAAVASDWQMAWEETEQICWTEESDCSAIDIRPSAHYEVRSTQIEEVCGEELRSAFSEENLNETGNKGRFGRVWIHKPEQASCQYIVTVEIHHYEPGTDAEFQDAGEYCGHKVATLNNSVLAGRNIILTARSNHGEGDACNAVAFEAAYTD